MLKRLILKISMRLMMNKYMFQNIYIYTYSRLGSEIVTEGVDLDEGDDEAGKAEAEGDDNIGSTLVLALFIASNAVLIIFNSTFNLDISCCLSISIFCNCWFI